MKIDIPIEYGYDHDQLFIVAPAKHPQKGMGWVLCPVTRELMSSEFPMLLHIVDSQVQQWTEPHVPAICLEEEGTGCICMCTDCAAHKRPTDDDVIMRFIDLLPPKAGTND